MGDASSPAVNWANAGTLDGVGVGSPTWGAAGQIGDAVALNGSSQYLSCGNYTVPTALTWGVWANWTAAMTSTHQIIATYYPTPSARFTGLAVAKVAGAVRIWLYAQQDSSNYRYWYWEFADAVMPHSAWYRLVLTQATAASTPTLYVNGVDSGAPVLANTLGSPVRAAATPLSIGRLGSLSAQYFPGTLDQASMANAVRSADAQKFDYACGTGSIFGSWEKVTGGISPLFMRNNLGNSLLNTRLIQ